jgi:hypothetical protein
MDGKGISDVNVTAFPYAMIEFDHVPLDLQLSLLAKLRLPITAITFSGAKSYHALIKVDAGSLDEYQKTVDDLYARMKRYGIDPNNRNASRMSRLPGVYRGDRQQRLVYLNPEPSTKGIL